MCMVYVPVIIRTAGKAGFDIRHFYCYFDYQQNSQVYFLPEKFNLFLSLSLWTGYVGWLLTNNKASQTNITKWRHTM